jgi:hypothetical protein
MTLSLTDAPSGESAKASMKETKNNKTTKLVILGLFNIIFSSSSLSSA